MGCLFSRSNTQPSRPRPSKQARRSQGTIQSTSTPLSTGPQPASSVPPSTGPQPATHVPPSTGSQPVSSVPPSTGPQPASSASVPSSSKRGRKEKKKPARQTAQRDGGATPSSSSKPGGKVPKPKKSKAKANTTAPQRVDTHSSGRKTGATTASSVSPGRPPAGTPSGSLAAERHEGPRFPSTLQSLLSKDFRFRILVVGKRDSGKSSLINTIFNVDMSKGPPTNVSGKTAEFRPPNNRHLIAHESSAFGPQELQAIRDFITTCNEKSRPASERIHAIWICVPMSDAINRQFDESVKILLDIGVPFIFVFTKFDLVPNVSSNIASGNDYEAAKAKAYAPCRSVFGNVRAEITSTQPTFRNLIEKLATTTDEVIIDHSRNISASSSEAQRTQPQVSPVALAWSVSQRASRDINIQAAIEVGRNRYWRGLWNSDDFAGQTLANCVEVIHADIVGVWNLPDGDGYLSSKAFKDAISYIVQDLGGPPISSSSRPKPDGTPSAGAAWLNNRYENGNENICLVVGYIVDLTLILCSVFGSPGNVSPSQVQSAMNSFGSGRKTSVHAEISRFIRTVPKFNYYDNDVVLEKIIDLIKQNCDPPFGNARL